MGEDGSSEKSGSVRSNKAMNTYSSANPYTILHVEISAANCGSSPNSTAVWPSFGSGQLECAMR